jgi:hypothetical protein
MGLTRVARRAGIRQAATETIFGLVAQGLVDLQPFAKALYDAAHSFIWEFARDPIGRHLPIVAGRRPPKRDMFVRQFGKVVLQTSDLTMRTSKSPDILVS